MPTESAPGRFVVLRRNLVTLPISGHGSSSQSSQSKARQFITSLTLAILRRFSLARRFGIGFAKIYWMKETNEVNAMKIATSFLPALVLFGSLGAGGSFAAAEGVMSNTVLVPDSYCHPTFPAIREDALFSDRPASLKGPSEGGIIDFYGSCYGDPRGGDRVHQQRLQRQHRWQRNYDD